MDTLMVESALRFAALGFRVIPCVGKKGVGGTFSRATTFDRQIVEWWNGPYEGHNLGVILDDDFLAVDLDVKHGGVENWERIAQSAPSTLSVLTPTGGRHHYFRYAGNRRIRGKDSLLAPGVDVWSGNRLMVAPPSVHPDTKTAYCFLIAPDWDTGGSVVAAAPDWLLERIYAAESLPAAARPGGRHQDLLRYAAHARMNYGYDAAELFTALQRFRDYKGYSAHDKHDGELMSIARSAAAHFDYNPDRPDPRAQQRIADHVAAVAAFKAAWARSSK